MTSLSAARCPLCGDRALEATSRRLVYPSGRERAFASACASCGLLLHGDEMAIRSPLRETLSGDIVVPDDDAPYGLDIYTLRIAATSRGRGVKPIGAAQVEALRHPHSDLAAQARLFDLEPSRRGVSLGILCRPADLDAVSAGLAVHAAWTDDIVILCDAPPAGPNPWSAPDFAPRSVRLASRPLGADFSEQRNALQALSRHDWMLQLDADETLTTGTGALLGALARMAEADGARSIGLPRRNLVEGVLSDVYPDTQYRLNHRSVRYRGRVHERPDRPWQQSLITLHGAIEHHLGRPHVDARSHRYEAMEPGGGRLDEGTRLLEAYRA